MINPETRALLSDALTPPPGFVFDCGFATTYSLDLVSLLAMPLHMAWLATGEDTADNIDPLRALEALRRTSERFTVFCERGRLQIPRNASPLLSLLENMVHEVTAPHGGAFHPKVWLLRFTPEEGERNAVLRLLVMSRNITDDASWDLSVCLEGSVGRKKSEAGVQLASFIKAVIGLSEKSKKSLSHQRDRDLDALIKDAGRAEWELPGHYEEIKFHALGLGRKKEQWLPTPSDNQWHEMGVISPFVKADALQAIAASCKTPLFVISRAEELDQTPDPLPGGYESLWVLAEGADQAEVESHTTERLTGLHAKAYIGRAGWNTHLFLGSANATDAALLHGNNVEFMVELIGRHSRVGTPGDWINENGMTSLLVPYQRSEALDKETQAYKDEKELERIRSVISALDLSLDCVMQESSWELHLQGLTVPMVEGLTVAVWPLTLRMDQAVSTELSDTETAVVMSRLMKSDITSFTGFRLQLNQAELCFGLDVPLRNPPADREADVLRSVIENREGFVRYLMLLLGALGPSAGIFLEEDGGSRQDWRKGGLGGEALFEMLANAYAREPEKLESIAALVKRLQAQVSDEGDGIVPDEFQALWSIVSEALEEEK